MSRRWMIVLGCSVWLAAASNLTGADHGDESPLELTPRLTALFSGAPPSDVEDLDLMQDHLRQVAERVKRCTVGVQVGGAQGSGVLISGDGFVMTAAHVCQEPNQVAGFIMPDGTRYLGKTLGVFRTIDAGLMKIDEQEDEVEVIVWPYLEMGDSSQLREGQWCVATGHPGGYERDRPPVVRFGRVLSSRDSVIRTDCVLVGGDSGGPLCDMKGDVIGIHSRIGGNVNINLHVPVDRYRDTWDRLAAGEDWGKTPGASSSRRGPPVIGVACDGDGDTAEVTSVTPNSPAEQAGLEPGDIIIRMNDKEITTFRSLQRQVALLRPGDKVAIVYLRDSEEVEVELTIGSRE